MTTLKEELLNSVQQLKNELRTRMQRGEQVTFFYRQPAAANAPVQAVKTKQAPAARSAMEALMQKVKACTHCELAKTRKRVVFGEGDSKAALVFVGEAPGVDEDREGKPFVGAAGQLLTKIIEAIGLKREQVYICNVLKCRPPGNRNPSAEEIEACQGYLKEQLKLLQPKLICALGTFAAQTLLNTKEPIGRLRGKTYSYEGIPVIPTFHPAALLYHPQNKKHAWADMRRVAHALDIKLPAKGKQ